MTPTRLRECLDVLEWTLRELARRLKCDSGTIRQMGTGKRPVHESLAAWLEMLAAVHGTLSPELRDIARQLGCDQGRFVRYPRGMRPLTDEEAALLETLATIHAALPEPVGWESGRHRPGESPGTSNQDQ
jgi:hypothetical protein